MTNEELNIKMNELLAEFYNDNVDEKRQFVHIIEFYIINPNTSNGGFNVKVKIDPEIPFSI